MNHFSFRIVLMNMYEIFSKNEKKSTSKPQNINITVFELNIKRLLEKEVTMALNYVEKDQEGFLYSEFFTLKF